MARHRPKLVSFSGIDGAGKSTQIRALESYLSAHGFRTRNLTFWDDIVLFSRFREFMSEKAFKGDKGVGSPERPIERRDKNVSTWYALAGRLCFYLADALSLRTVAAATSRRAADVVIFDRFIYDEIANLPLGRWEMRAFAKLLLAIGPKPDVAYVIDADPDAAYRRKPEYPLEFLRRNRDAYLILSHLIPELTVISPGSQEQMTAQVIASAWEKVGGDASPRFEAELHSARTQENTRAPVV